MTAICILAVTATAAFGTVWKVDSNQGVVADFTTLQAAHDDGNVKSGDTLYVSGSPVHYGSLTLSKRLNIIGPGYFLSENPNTQVGFLPAKVTRPTFRPGAEESVISGMMIEYGLYVYCDGVIIRNNYATATYNDQYIKIDANNVII